MSLVARHLEANGIPTVVVGSAKDIVEFAAVPRFLFVDFPLGNPMGLPHDRAMQFEIAKQAVTLLGRAEAPETTERAPYEWPGPEGWRAVYNRVTDENREELRAVGEQRRAYRGALPKRTV